VCEVSTTCDPFHQSTALQDVAAISVSYLAKLLECAGPPALSWHALKRLFQQAPGARFEQLLARGDERTEPGALSLRGRKERKLHMSTMVTWNPFRELDEVQNRLSSFFGGGFNRLGNGNGGLKLASWSPQVDITEDEKEYLVKADLPEVKKDDVKVTVENGVLSVSGERKTEKEEKKRKFHRIERSYGSFERTFTLPDDADAAKVVAEFKEGVLKVHLPKSPTAKPKTIEVKVT